MSRVALRSSWSRSNRAGTGCGEGREGVIHGEEQYLLSCRFLPLRFSIIIFWAIISACSTPPSRLWPPLVEWRLAVGDEGTFFFFFFPLLLLDLLDDGTTLSYEKEILRPHVLRATNQQAYGEGGGNWEADIEVTGGSLFLCLLSTIRGSSHQKERLGFFFSFLILPLDRVFFFSPPSVLIVFLVTFSGA